MDRIRFRPERDHHWAAVGSLSASIATAFYMRSLTRGHEMVRRANGDITADPSQALPAIDENIGSERTRADADVSANGESRVWFSKKVFIGAASGLIIAVGAIWAFEFISGNPFGQAETPSIGRPWQPAPEPDNDGTCAQPPPTQHLLSPPRRQAQPSRLRHPRRHLQQLSRTYLTKPSRHPTRRHLTQRHHG
jgi:hypothetical protein